MKKLICILLAVVMIFAMAACADENKEAYEAAVAAYNAGDYEAASEQLYALGDYKDAAALLASIKAEKGGATIEVVNANGHVIQKAECIFKNGNLIKETVTDVNGIEVKNYYKYDDQGLCTSETLNVPDGGKIVINHFYDGGIKVRSIRTNVDKSKDTYEYVCDENGKVLSHVLTLSDGTVEEATYTYSDVTGLLVSIQEGTTETVFSYNQFGDVTNEYVTVDGADFSEASYYYTYTYIVG